MQFILVGFKQDTGSRVFTFEHVATDKVRTEFMIRADLALAQKHGIRLQDLPLLCRGLLERGGEEEQNRPSVFSEDEMRLHARHCAEVHDAAMLKKKAARRPLPPHGENASGNWQRSSHDGKAAAATPEQALAHRAV
jgi:hypothetical protein